tara:strand:+ start:45 stop:584 length:540 start_codon:yes stop_codon:yes gene_type:complete
MKQGVVIAVCLDDQHNFSKNVRDSINLVEGVGVEGDAHSGKLVQHRVLQSRDPSQPNLRQVHLLDIELLDELQSLGHNLNPGDMGENITTKGINLVELPLGTLLHLGETVTLEVTGLRNPCPLIEEYKTDLYKMFRDDKRNLIRKAGIMSVVLKAGSIISNDVVTVELPSEPHKELGFL